MVEYVAKNNIRHGIDRAPFLGTIVPSARAPAVTRPIYMDLSSDVAVSHPTTRHDGDWVRAVIDTVEVAVHLCKQ